MQALERHRKTGGPLKCKKCTSDQQEKERLEAERKRASSSIGGTSGVNGNGNGDKNDAKSSEQVTCAACKKALDPSKFKRNQLSKHAKARCISCVEESVKKEETQRQQSKDDKLAELQKLIKEAEAKGDVMGRVRYESQVAALEGERVTGLKPISMGRGRSRGRGGRGRGGRGTRSNTRKQQKFLILTPEIDQL